MTTILTTSTRDGTKDSSRYTVSGTEGDGKTLTITYLNNKATMDVGHVPLDDL